MMMTNRAREYVKGLNSKYVPTVVDAIVKRAERIAEDAQMRFTSVPELQQAEQEIAGAEKA